MAALLLLLALMQSPETAEKIRRAGDMMQAGRAAEAIPLYRELAAEYPGVPSFGINLAVAQYKAGLYQDAIAQCQALIRLRPDIFPAWLFLGASLTELGQPAAAVEPLKKAVELQPEDRNARVMLAGALLDSGRPAEAAAEYEEAAKRLPESPRVVYGLARSYEAVAAGLSEQAQGAEAAALAAALELERGRYARAFELYRKALAASPAFPGAHAAIAAIYEKTGHADWAAAERDKEPPAESAAQVSELYTKTLECRERSRKAYDKLAALGPSRERFEAEARRQEASALYPQAAAAWKQALALAPGDARIGREYALALCHANDCASALPVIKGLLGRKPGSAELNYLYGLALSDTREFHEALRYLETAVKLDAKLLAARAALGQAYLEAGQPANAVEQLEAAIAEDEDGSRHYQLARAYQASGRPDKAAAVLRDYREILKRREAAGKAEPQITPPQAPATTPAAPAASSARARAARSEIPS